MPEKTAAAVPAPHAALLPGQWREQPDKQAFEVIGAGLLNFAALDVDIFSRLFARGKVAQVNAERDRIWGKLLLGLLKWNKKHPARCST